MTTAAAATCMPLILSVEFVDFAAENLLMTNNEQRNYYDEIKPLRVRARAEALTLSVSIWK